MSDIDTNRKLHESQGTILAPISQRKGASDAEVYNDCWNKYWCCNKRDPERWEYLNTVVWIWTTKKVLGCRNVAIKLPKSVCLKAKKNLKMAENNDDDSVM
ncbi:hypothetical protein O6H91_07G107300 [Diphasiastrum complanatum]|uniref:Uncharacterized protein n=1 Tax=Diphasiastrum complanatum TaxID=34168 RepID=A0ACC2D8P6_DIPCM|nr:hypothetical protein O6H91_07G107300 [Diphasiastrum complanatum]